MGRRAHTSEFYYALLKGYREFPGDHTAAAKAAGCERRAAKRTWESGWSDKQWARPIKDVLADEQVLARAQLQPAGPATEREKARQDAIEARAQTGRVIRSARGNALGILVTTSKLLVGVVGLAESARLQLERLKEDGTVDVATVVNLLKSVAWATEAGSRSAKMAMEMERIELGVMDEGKLSADHPTELPHDMTLEEVERRLAAAQAAVERAKQNGTFEALDTPTASTPPA